MKTKKLQKLYNIAEQEAINILKYHLVYIYNHRGDKFDCIINAMGTTAFYKNHNPLWDHEAEKLVGYSKLEKFLNDWNNSFRLTGYPIKIDKNGLKENNEFK